MYKRKAVVSSLSRFANSRTEASSPSTSKFAMDLRVHQRRQKTKCHANRGKYGIR